MFISTAVIMSVDFYFKFHIAQPKLIKKLQYRSGLRCHPIASIKKVHYYSTEQIAQMLLIKKQKVSEWALLCYTA